MENLPAINISEVQKVVSEAPDILAANETSVSRAKEAGQKLIALVETDGMSDLLDGQLSVYQAKIKSTVKAMNEKRKPFTQLVDQLKKRFTGLESELDPINSQIQSIRNSYAQKVIAEQKERERIAEAKRLKDIELIEVRGKINVLIRNLVGEYISSVKRGLNDMFEAYTLDTISGADIAINGTSEILPDGFVDKMQIPIQSTILTVDELSYEIGLAKTPLLASLNAEFMQAIAAEKRSLIDKLPSKKSELEEIANADAEEKKRLEAEAKKRKDEEAERIRKEEQDAKDKAAEDVAVKTSGEVANATVSAQASMIFSDVKVKEGYEIVIKNNAAYLQIAQFWFEKEGKNLTPDKIERKTFAQMRAFCESWALKSEEKINSPFIDYKETIKAK